MKRLQNLFLKESAARSVADIMKNLCYFLVILAIVCLILSLIGRQQFVLHTGTSTYDYAIYSEKDHEWHSRGPTVTMKDTVHVLTYTDGKIDVITHIGLFAMYAVGVIPMGVCFWFLGKVFRNVSNGSIFTEQNANYLLYYGLMQVATAIFAPLIKLLICNITNVFTSNHVSISTGQNILSDLFTNIAFIVAAYIIHYGIRLQDEADHTL